MTTKKMITKMLKNLSFRYIVINRSYEMCKFKIVKFILGLIIHRYKNKYGIYMNFSNIGSGLCIPYPHNIIINSKLKIGQYNI